MDKWKDDVRLKLSGGIPVCCLCENSLSDFEEVFAVPQHPTTDIDDDQYSLICTDCFDNYCGYKTVRLIALEDPNSGIAGGE